jgi:hypothetical protein
MIGDIVYNILSNDSNVTGLVGTKIYPLMATQGTELPYITYQVISTSPNKNKDREISLKAIRLQIDIIGNTYSSVTNISDKVVDAISYKTGNYSGYDVDIITFEDENDLSDIENDFYRKEQDYIIRIKI